MLKQLRQDLLGKDSYRGISLTYAWLANQFGHFSLGFIPALLLLTAFDYYFPNWNNRVLFSALIAGGIWFCFEFFNIVWQFRQSTKKGGSIKPDYANVIEDTTVDVLFFFLGSFSYAAIVDEKTYFTWIACALLLVLIFFGVKWYRIKVYQQYANLPFQKRLSQLETIFSEAQLETIKRFNNANELGIHLLIFGAYEKGKTSLGVALANEKAIKNHMAYYTTAIKLYSLFELDNEEDKYPWNWRQSEYTVVDDINPDANQNLVLIDAKVFFQILSSGPKGEINLQTLLNKSFIWVHGANSELAISKANSWKEELIMAGVAENKIFTIILS